MSGLNIDPSTLKNSWSAVVKQNNGQVISIWYTAWPSSKDGIAEILSIASDYPRHIIQ